MRNLLRPKLFWMLLGLLVVIAPRAIADTQVSGTISTNTTWTLAGSPYIVTGDVWVYGSVAPILTIEAGVTVKFNSGTALYISNGSSAGGLQAVGTATSPITFTANTTNPPVGYWGGIVFYSAATSTSQIAHATVSYGGSSYAAFGGISVFGPSPTIQNTTVQNNAYAGINVTGGSPKITRSTLTGNTWALRFSGGSPSVTSTTVSSNTTGGIYVASPCSPSLQTLTISNNTGFAMSQDPFVTLGTVSGMTATGNTTNGVEVRGSGSSSSSATWKSFGLPFVVTGDVWFFGSPAASVLTIAAGVTVKFNSGTALYISNGSSAGGLQAVGTATSPITFTANTTNPPVGYWGGIVFYSAATSTSQIAHATVSYGGSSYAAFGGISVFGPSVTIQDATVQNNAYAGINVAGGSPTIKNSTISGNAVGVRTSYPATPSLQTLTFSGNTGFAISQDIAQTLGTVTGLTMTNNGTDGVELRSGTVGINTTWKNVGWPYVLSGYNYVQGSGTPVLTIAAGVTLKCNAGALLYVGSGSPGGLQAVGTSSKPITFTANTASPTPGYWNWIEFGSQTISSSTIAYATVSYGGSLYSGVGAIRVAASSPTISNVALRNNLYAGISINGGSPVIVSSTFTSNSAGIINATPNLWVNASLNYWDSATGPSGSGPGTGQSVSAGVLFNPWLTAAPVSPEYLSSATDSNLAFNPATGQASWSLKASQSSSWTFTVSNSSQVVVRTITGSGTTFNPTWNGKNDAGVVQPDGVYSYVIQAVAGSNSASPGTGSVRVDSQLTVALTSPSSGQTLSNVYTNGVTDVPVIGTATMTGFAGWQLDYGAGSTPTSWTTLGTGTQAVSNGTFATWSTLPISNQLYTLRLIAWDTAGRSAEATVSPTVANFSASENALQLSAPAGNTVTYSSIVPFTLTETITVKNAAGQLVRTLVNGVSRPAATYNDTWNGKSDSGGFLPDGPYFYFATVTDGTHTFTWDQTNQYYNDLNAEQNPSFQAWDPFNNTPLTFSYNFDQPGRVNVAFKHGDGGGCTPPSFCLAPDKYEESGPHTIAWAGVDSTGALRFDVTWIEVGSSRAIFSKNAIVLYGTKPSVTIVTVTPAAYGPAVGTQTVAFDLAAFQNRVASVTVTFLNQASLSVLRTIALTNQLPGHKTVTWDGRADNGMWVAPGFYTVTVKATDSLGNQVQGQILTTIQY